MKEREAFADDMLARVLAHKSRGNEVLHILACLLDRENAVKQSRADDHAEIAHHYDRIDALAQILGEIACALGLDELEHARQDPAELAGDIAVHDRKEQDDD